jgi:hypothetical protein
MHERELQKKVKGQKQLKELEVERQWEEHERAVAEAYDEKLKEMAALIMKVNILFLENCSCMFL